MTRLREIRSIEFDRARDALAALLLDAVTHGASLGFVLPLTLDDTRRWADSLRASIDEGQRLLWVAERGDQICGSIQLDLCSRPNGRNRAEVQKLMVHSAVRRGGLGRMLMLAAETRARELERGLLFLDTEADSPAEGFYRSLGYTCIGGLPEYACTPDGSWKANAIYFKTLFRRNPA